MEFTTGIPHLAVPPPGPASRDLAARLARVECRDTTYLSDRFPVFWERAHAANVWDVDGNRYVDLTSAFGVALLGHGHPAVVEALQAQAAQLAHGMGDVHPTALKVEVAERLAAIAPGGLGVTLFGNTGSEAVEAALKTAMLCTGRPGVLAFEHAYHGLGYGALAATWREDFRAPFRAQLNPHVVHIPFPQDDTLEAAQRALEAVDAALGAPAGQVLGAVLAEPIQGRGGIRVPHLEFLRGLREICTRRGRLLILDEILTGLGRTGRWFACEHAGVVPDVLCVGKVLGGGLPLSACIGTADVMHAWGVSGGEARHTFTHLGNPMACAAARATLDVLRTTEVPAQAAAQGLEWQQLLAALRPLDGVAAVRGQGLLWGIELRDSHGEPDGARAFDIVCRMLQRGVLLLGDGSRHEVLACMPPVCLQGAPRAAAVDALEACLRATEPGA